MLTDILMALLTPVLHGQYLWAKAITAFFVLLRNFFLRRQLLFARNPIWKVRRQFAELSEAKNNSRAVPFRHIIRISQLRSEVGQVQC